MRKVGHVLTLCAALGIAGAGLLAGSLVIMTSLIQPGNEPLAVVVLGVSFLTLTLGLGLVLGWHAWQAIQGGASRPFRPRRAWVLGPLCLLAVLAGQLILSLDLLPVLTFSPFYVLAAILPPVCVVAVVGQALGGVTRWRDIVLQLSSGAFLSTSLAFTLELTCILVLLTSLLAVIAAQQGGLEQIQDLVRQIQDPTWLQDPAELALLLKSPAVLASALLLFAVVVPVIEEAVKTLGVGLLAYRHPGLSQAFLWGVAGGAGFALTEGLLNSVGGLDVWAPIALARVGATLLHCFTGALMGLAWHAILAKRRWDYSLGLYAASVGIHGLWNALSGGMALISVGTLDGKPTDIDKALAGLATAAVLGLLVALALAMGLGLVGLTRYVRSRTGPTQAPKDRPSGASLETAAVPMESMERT